MASFAVAVWCGAKAWGESLTILVFGKTGQVAHELAQHAGITCLSRTDADLTDPAACAAIIMESDATAVINAAAYTAVDKAEDEPDLAYIINAAAPTAMAQACSAKNLPFVHISTDYVFDGSGDAPWKPTDPTGPLGVYGASKLGGEDGLRAAGGTYAILRTSWVFSAQGNNFVKTMLRLGAERDALSIIADQIGGPTAAKSIADVALTLVKVLTKDGSKTGTYHFAGTPSVSWADFAREIFSQAGLACSVTDIPTTAYPTPAMRPANSRLDCTDIEATFGVVPSDWRAELARVLTTLKVI